VGETKPAPFLRWAGGKRRLLPTILSSLPPGFNSETGRLYEPFVGGGAVMFALADPAAVHVRGANVVIGDVNPDLIAAYTAIRDDVDGLVAHLQSLAEDTSKAGFEKVKRMVPASDLERAARLIYLNKTCFNGLWRVNSKGEFNVPYGRVATPVVCNEPLLRACAARLAGAQVRLASYQSVLNDARAGDLVYLDPPYLPLSPSSAFSKYAKDDFGKLDHYALAGVIRGLSERGVYVMLSNSDVALTRQIFGGLLELRSLDVSRSISASGASRGKVGEVLGVNYVATGALASLPRVAELAHSKHATGRAVS
jgi:DNA adenine methylase